MQFFDESTISMLRLLFRGALWVFAGVGASLLFAVCQPYFLRICDEVLSVGAGGRKYFDARLQEARNSVRTLWGWPINDWLPLRRLIDALNNLGVKQMDRLQQIGATLSAHSSSYTALKMQFSAPQELTPKQFVAETEKAQKFGTTLLVVGLVVVMITILNTYLLHLFFASLFTDMILFRWPFTVYLSMVLALLFSAFEIAAGIFMHVFEDLEEKHTAMTMVMKMGPWLTLAALMIVETIAYSLMSVNMHVADKLQVAPDSDFYPIINYFLAFFGASITLSLMTGGYIAWTAFQKFSASVSVWWAIARWERAEKAYAKMKESSKAIDENCKSAVAALKELPEDISDDFRKRIAVNADVPATLELLRRRVESWKSHAEDTTSPRYSVHPILVAPLAFLLMIGALLGLFVCWVLQTLAFGAMQAWRFCSMLGDAILDRVRPRVAPATVLGNEA